MIDGKHGVRLAAAERGLKLDNRVAALAVEATGNGCEQQAHSLGDEGALEECRRVLILPRGLAGVNRRDVGGELGLLERTFEHVRVRDGDFSPRFQAHKRGMFFTTDGRGWTRMRQSAKRGVVKGAVGFMCKAVQRS